MSSTTDRAVMEPNEVVKSGTHGVRSELRAAGRHSLVYLVAPAVSNVVGFLLIPLYTHFIDRSHYGLMSLVDVAMTLTIMVLGLGMADGLTRFYYETSDAHARRVLVSTVLCGPAVLSLPGILVAVMFAGKLCQPLGLSAEYADYLRVALVTAWFSMLAEIGFTYLRICYLARLFVVITIVQILSSVSLNIWFVVGLDWGIWGILYSTLLVQTTLGTSLAAILLWRSGSRPSLVVLRQLLAFGIHLVPSTVALQMSNYLNPIMLRWLLVGDPAVVFAQVGLFAAGQKMGVVVNRFVTVPFQAFWRPRRMELVTQHADGARDVLARICSVATLVTCQVALLISVGAEPALKLLVARPYWDAHRVVPLICASYVVLSLEHHFCTGMHVARKTHWAPLIGVVSLSTLLICNLVLVPLWGIVGAAASALASVTVRSGMFWLISQRFYPIAYEIDRLLGMALVALICYYLGTRFEFDSTAVTLAIRLAIASVMMPVWLLGDFLWSRRGVLEAASS